MMHLTSRDGGTVHILASAVVAIRPDSGFRDVGEIKGWPASTSSWARPTSRSLSPRRPTRLRRCAPRWLRADMPGRP
jgi:hypothetical protein